MLRETVDHLRGDTQRVIDFAGIAEIRPDEGEDADGDGAPDGIMFMRIPANGGIAVEEARSLADGTRVFSESGYIHSDIRGSVLAKTHLDGPSLLITHHR